MDDDTFREINSRPILWRNGKHMHICEGVDLHPGVRLLWTLCKRDVPANAAFHPAPGDRATCPVCIAASEEDA